MSQSFRRILCIFLVIIMVAALLTGCAKKATTDSNASGQATKATEEKDEYFDDPNVTRTIEWLGCNYFEIPEDAVIKKWVEEKYNVKMHNWYIDPKNQTELLNLKLAANEIPDIWLLYNRSELSRYIQQGVSAEVPQEVIRKYAPDFAKKLDDLGPLTWFYNTFDGKNYAIPAFNYMNSFSRPIVWRGDWLKKVGITEIPKTLAEFEKAFYKFKNEDPDNNGKNDTYALSNGAFNAIFGAFGYMPDMVEKTTKNYAQYALRDGKVVCGSVQPEMKDALAYLSKWYKDGVLDPEWVTGEFEGSLSKPFVNGRIGFTAYGNFYHYMPAGYDPNSVGANYTNLKKLMGDSAEMAFGTAPVGPTGKFGTNLGDMYGLHMVLGKQLEKDKPRMARILKIVNDIYTDPETFLTVRYGFEGQHWDYDKDKNIIQKPQYTTSSNLEAFTKLGSHVTYFWFMTPDTFNVASPSWYKFTDKYIPATKDYRSVVPTGMLPSITKYQEELFKITTEAYAQIIMGTKDISYFDEYVKQWRAAGGDILEKEANELYVEYQKVLKK